jgi:hypothetical protein
MDSVKSFLQRLLLNGADNKKNVVEDLNDKAVD